MMRNLDSNLVTGFIHKIKVLGPNLAFIEIREPYVLVQQLKIHKIVVKEPQLIKEIKDLREETMTTLETTETLSLRTQSKEKMLVKVLEYTKPEKITPILLSKDLSFDNIDRENPENFIIKRSHKSHNVQAIRTLLVKHTIDFFVNKKKAILINAPCLSSTFTQSGSQLFEVVNPFQKNSLNLMQSPQLYKEYMINAGLYCVFDVNTIFRAENSNTTKHLCETTCLDFETFLKKPSVKVLTKTIEDYLIFVTKKLGPLFNLKTYTKKDFGYITYDKCLKLLNVEDLSSKQEKKLPSLLKKDFVFVTNYPVHKRPFYTHQNQSFDLLCDFCELSSGSVRVLEHAQLKSRLPSELKDTDYFNSFNYGMVPHGGFGLGLDRFLTYYLQLPNIKDCKFHKFLY